jgi:bacterioferritin-associated ferredoxin
MYVCVCSAVTDRQIHEAVDRGASSLFDVQSRLPVGMCCGRCQETAKAMVDEYVLSSRRKNAA